MLDAFDDQEELEFEDDFDDEIDRIGHLVWFETEIVQEFQYSNISLEFQI